MCHGVLHRKTLVPPPPLPPHPLASPLPLPPRQHCEKVQDCPTVVSLRVECHDYFDHGNGYVIRSIYYELFLPLFKNVHS